MDVKMSGIVYQPLNRAQREIRLILLDDGNEAIDGGGGGAARTPLRCQLITTSLAFYSTKSDDDIVDMAMAVMVMSMSGSRPTLLLGLYKLLKFVRLAVTRITKRKPASYSALSYVWGDPKCVCDIEVNGKVAKITKTLAEALQSIRANTSIRVIWADAICINQEDDDEKSWQVQEMRTIYKRAARVVSWLGPATAQTEVAFTALGNLKRSPNSALVKLVDQWRPRNRIVAELKDAISILLEDLEYQNAGFGTPWKFKNAVAALEDAVSILVEDLEFRDAVLSMANHPYWSRIWIFQELACARRRTFLCGDSSMKEFDLILRAVMNWRGLPRTPVGNLLRENFPSMVSAAHTLQLRNRKLHLGPRPGYKRRQLLSWFRSDDFPFLLTLLRRLHPLHATDARDHVYALASIAGDRRELNITPDYTKSVTAVFTETTCALLQCGHLGVLLDATRSDSRPDLSSWVPDWSNLSELKFEAGLYRLHKSRTRQRSSTLDKISASSSYIDLDGYIVDEIVLVGHTYWSRISHKGERKDDTSFEILKTWQESIETTLWDHARYIGAQNARQASTKQSITIELLLTATSGRLAMIEATPPMSTIDEFTSMGLMKSRFMRSTKEHFEELTASSFESDEVRTARCVDMIMKRLISKNGAQPFRTLTGYSCLAAHDRCKSGDLVVILPGVGIPLVVRKTTAEGAPRKHQYRLIDQAYVHGIMYGEFFKQNPRPGYQTLTLC